MSAALICTAGSVKDQTFELGNTEVSVGRSTSNTIVIDDMASPRRHLVIVPVGDERYELQDLGSKSGTLVNEVWVQRRLLEHNDTIRIGHTVFVFRKLHSESSAPADATPPTPKSEN